MSDYVGGTVRCEVCAREFLTKPECDKHYFKTHRETVKKQRQQKQQKRIKAHIGQKRRKNGADKSKTKYRIIHMYVF